MHYKCVCLFIRLNLFSISLIGQEDDFDAYLKKYQNHISIEQNVGQIANDGILFSAQTKHYSLRFIQKNFYLKNILFVQYDLLFGNNIAPFS